MSIRLMRYNQKLNLVNMNFVQTVIMFFTPPVFIIVMLNEKSAFSRRS
jgi:hypothetical protein